MGGHAFTDTELLSADTGQAIVDALRATTGWDLEPVGSFGFKPLLPDLDLIVPADQFNRAAIDAIGATRTYNLGGAGLRYVHAGTPYQVDFFPTVTKDWGRFARAGAKDSGALRALLLKAAAATFEEPGVDFHVWDDRDDRDFVLRVGRTLDQRVGLRRIIQHRIRKDGLGLLKVPQTIDGPTYSAMFAQTALADVPTISDPLEVQRLILGGPDVFDSAADLAAYMARTFKPDRWRRARRKVLARMPEAAI